ncbi:methyltransferase [Marinobacter zhanjiangensis]|uniref:Methyltransferase n=1 Tax=Marinobacter zhanjiangensis TaxID=578215 RepID=A0ABQ3AZT5_9GAMM|nr:methyltransferase [Marinobacter zhanjiangensis]GGY71876.1 methyltransferase [Marinobacter zhanjiangensis]
MLPFSHRWQHLDDWLWQHRGLWQPVPFAEPAPSWTRDWPALAAWLGQLDNTHCEVYEKQPERLAEAVSHWLPALSDYAAMVSVPDLSPGPPDVGAATLAEREAVDMPGRKRQQAGAFTAALLPLAQSPLDWCCGKGHLSRTLARRGKVPVIGYEWNAELVRDGNRLTTRYGDAVTLQCQDVMAEDLPWPPKAHGVALHACGDLHRKLIRDAVEQRQPRLSFSPCCYHLTTTRDVVPLSFRAQSSHTGLVLSREDLRLAVRETVTAPAGVRAQTARASRWRLGFDGLQRWLRGVDEYLPLPPHPKRLAGDGFEAFCRWAAELKGISLPEGVNFDHWLEHGVERAATVRRYELLRHLFRRPLELWLVLDYALFLEESGYHVRMGTFCERELTPRNLLVDAAIAQP